MVTRHVVVVRSGPGEPESASALGLARTMLEQGHEIAIVLIQDAVLCALANSRLDSAGMLRALVKGGASCPYLAGDLAMRGFVQGDVLARCQPLNEGELVDLLLGHGVLVAGAF